MENYQGGEAHDVRAPDYDDWTTPNEDGFAGLNGDILVWNPVLQDAFEVSSMGIRVDPETLMRQLTLTLMILNVLELDWHKALMHGDMPQTIGGGIGQSRLVMLLLQKSILDKNTMWRLATRHPFSFCGYAVIIDANVVNRLLTQYQKRHMWSKIFHNTGFYHNG